MSAFGGLFYLAIHNVLTLDQVSRCFQDGLQETPAFRLALSRETFAVCLFAQGFHMLAIISADFEVIPHGGVLQRLSVVLVDVVFGR